MYKNDYIRTFDMLSRPYIRPSDQVPSTRRTQFTTSFSRAGSLAHGDVEAKRRWVVVLEEFERQAASGLNLEGDPFASTASVRGDDVAVAALHARYAADIRHRRGWDGVVGGLLGRRGGELVHGDATLTIERVRRSL